VMTARKRSVRLAVHSLLSWTLNATGLAVGFLRRPEARGAAAAPVEA